MKFGGIEKHVERLSVGLAKRGHKVFVYTRPWYTPALKKKYQGVNLISLKSIQTKHFDAISHTFAATMDVMRKNFDIVHYHGVGPALLAWIPKLFKPKTKVIITFHCIDRKHQKWGALARFFLYLGEWMAVKFAHDTITVSKTLQHYCKEQFGAKTLYIPNGVDASCACKADIIKNKFGLEKDSYILFMSRLIKHKGLHYLIEAYNGLKTNKKLVIAGDGSYTDSYVKEIKKLANHNPNIIFTGNVAGASKLWCELFSNAYLFVHPSESEGLPIVVLEAMSFGRGVLASSIQENLELVGAGHGFVFENKNISDLKDKIKYLIENPSLVKEVGTEARDFVLENYNWQDIVDSVEHVYEDVSCEHLQVKSLKSKVQSPDFAPHEATTGKQVKIF